MITFDFWPVVQGSKVYILSLHKTASNRAFIDFRLISIRSLFFIWAIVSYLEMLLKTTMGVLLNCPWPFDFER